VGDVGDNSIFVAAQIVHEPNNFIFALRVESARDLVAKEKDRIGNELESERKTATLPAGKNFDVAIAESIESCCIENAIDELFKFLARLGFRPKANGAFDILFYGEFFVSDTELGHVSDLGMFEVALFGEISSVPVDRSVGFLIDPGDQFEERRLSAAGWADNCHEVSGRHSHIDFFEQVKVIATFLDGEVDVF
jgi:hypothetical protein